MSIFTYALLLALCFLFGHIKAKLSCIGQDGNAVDRYVLYKLPEITWRQVPDHVRNGSAYAYFGEDDDCFVLSPTPITSKDSAAGRTLNQVYDSYTKRNAHGTSDQAHLFYNDENPEGKEFFTHGHTKGALAFDGESGFWLVHSVPRYPPAASDGYAYPASGHRYGQTYMCITLNSSMINNIGLQLRYNNPHIHDYNFPDAMKDDFPNINELVKGKFIKDPPYRNLLEFTSLQLADYFSFSKGTKFANDLYSSFVAPNLKTDLLTETWQHGDDNIGPSCDGDYTVEDIAGINLKMCDGSSYSFHNSNDHSKFAVGKEKHYVCIGDINRQTSQYKRGGGTVCKLDERLWKVFQSLPNKINTCS